MVYTIDSEVFKEILKKRANNTTGRILKRVEINLPIEEVKKEIREVIYEEYRILEEILENYIKADNFYSLRQKNPA